MLLEEERYELKISKLIKFGEKVYKIREKFCQKIKDNETIIGMVHQLKPLQP